MLYIWDQTGKTSPKYMVLKHGLPSQIIGFTTTRKKKVISAKNTEATNIYCKILYF